MLVVSGKRNISLKEVLKYSLGPIPWSLATAKGSFVKTPKSKLLDAIENDAHDPLVAALPERSVRIFDGMVLLQQLTSVSLSTFGEISEYLLKRITSSPAKIIYFVTDQYKDDSIKGSERQRRASSVIRIQISRREQKRPKQFKKYLGHGCNKVDLVKFLLLDWSDRTRFKQIISGRVIFVTVESDCHRIYVDEDVVKCSREEELSSNQEEADTKMFLCCQHAVNHFSAENVCISTVDSDVAVLAIYYYDRVQCNLFVEIGAKSKKRILSISNIREKIGNGMASSLPGLHAISGCDANSALYGIGKQKVYKIVKGSERYQETLVQLGESFTFNQELFSSLQEMVSECYGLKDIGNRFFYSLYLLHIRTEYLITYFHLSIAFSCLEIS